MIIDDFGRIHDYLRISLTDRCNLRCSYCIPYDFPSGFFANTVRMNPKEIDNIVSEFVALGINKIRLTGGEPLVRKEAKNIINIISKYPVELAITTNGKLVDEYIDTFIGAGIKAVNLSLDTLNRKKYFTITKRDYFQKIFSNIHLLLENNFNVKINVVVMKGVNDDEITDFIALTKEHPLQIRFIEFMPFAGNEWKKDKVFSCKDILKLINEQYDVRKLSDKKNDTDKKYKVEGFEGSFGVISTISEPFCESCNRIRLTADGKLKNCLFSEEEVDLLTPLREGQEIRSLILECMSRKKEEQGKQNISHLTDAEIEKIKNRNMRAIGG